MCVCVRACVLSVCVNLESLDPDQDVCECDCVCACAFVRASVCVCVCGTTATNPGKFCPDSRQTTTSHHHPDFERSD